MYIIESIKAKKIILFLNCVCCHSEVTAGCGGMYWTVLWLRIADSAAWNWVCDTRTADHYMGTVPVMEMWFLGILNSGKCLQKRVIDKLIEIYSVICIFKTFKRDYYQHNACTLNNVPPTWIFSWFFFWKIWENLSFIKVRQEKRVIYVKTNTHF